jgi:hypothetical protein
MRRAFVVTSLLCLTGSAALAEDPVKVDPQHYKVEFENAQVRVLRVHFGPHERSVMHSHPDGVAIFLSDVHNRSMTPDGKSIERTGKAGDTNWVLAASHLPENLLDTPLDALLVELKSAPAPVNPPGAGR